MKNKRKIFDKRNVFELFKEGFILGYKNPSIILPFLFNWFVSFFLLFVGLLVVFSIMGISLFNLTVLSNLSQEEFYHLLDNFSLLMGIKIFAVIFIFIISSLLISSYFKAGAIGMSHHSLRFNKKISLKEMNFYGKKFFLRYFLYQIFINFIIILFLSIFFIPLIKSQNLIFIILFLIAFIISIIFYLFVWMSPLILISKDCSIWQSIEKSFIFVKRNFLMFIGLGALYLIASLILQFIPYIGVLIYSLILEPAKLFSFMLFLNERSK